MHAEAWNKACGHIAELRQPSIWWGLHKQQPRAAVVKPTRHTKHCSALLPPLVSSFVGLPQSLSRFSNPQKNKSTIRELMQSDDDKQQHWRTKKAPVARDSNRGDWSPRTTTQREARDVEVAECVTYSPSLFINIINVVEGKFTTGNLFLMHAQSLQMQWCLMITVKPCRGLTCAVAATWSLVSKNENVEEDFDKETARIVAAAYLCRCYTDCTQTSALRSL